MTTELPEPKSRKESYLAKVAGMDTTIPEKPESREEQYLEAIAEGGGGGGGGVTVVQTTGSSTTDVMSQDATTKMIYPDIANYPNRIVINSGNASANYVLAINGDSASLDGIAISPDSSNTAKIGTLGRAVDSIAIGRKAVVAFGDNSISIGYNSASNSGGSTGYNVAIGSDAKAGNLSHKYTVALGAHASTTRDGEVNIGTGSTTNGYNSTKYRVLGGVHDPVDAHDAATKGYVDAQSGGGAIHVLTTADNNYDSGTGTLDSVALWLLPTGIYSGIDTSSVNIWIGVNPSDSELVDGWGLILISNAQQPNDSAFMTIMAPGENERVYEVAYNDGEIISGL